MRKVLLLVALVVLVLAVRLKGIGQELSYVLVALAVVSGLVGLLTNRPEDAKELEAVARELAADVQRESDARATRYALVESSALPVAWQPAGAALAEDWADLVRTARGLPGGPPAGGDNWPADATGLAGTYPQIGEVFLQRVPTHRLLVLGEHGSGKTALLIRLLQELVRPEPGGPVPVLFSLASWNPAEEDLRAWMAEQLRRNRNVALRKPARGEPPGTDRAQALVDSGLVLPLLDGFDEIPPALHSVALHGINQAWRTRPLVLACRTDVYRAALDRPDARRLDGAAGVRLVPLAPGPAAAYLRAGLPDPSRWNPVVDRLGGDTPVGLTLSTPLGLYLARTVYAPPPRAGEPEPLRHPDELCDTTAWGTREELERHLFSRFLTAVYDDGTGAERPRGRAPRARHALTVLARHLEALGGTDLAWWELSRAVPAGRRLLTAALAAGLVGAVAVGLVVAFGFGPGWGLLGAAAGGLATGLAARAGLRGAADVVYPSARFRSTLIAGLLAAVLVAGVVYRLNGVYVVQVVGGLAGLVLFEKLSGRLSLERADLTVRIGPRTLVVQDRRIFVRIVLVYTLAFGAWGVFLFGLRSAFGFVPALGVAGGLAVGLTVGLARGFQVGCAETAWAQFAVTRACLAMRGDLPWSLMSFLGDAHARGVLRQVGTVHQFRHISLQRHLAGEPRPDR
ncbi:NACHT domain-containing protein [Streptomyces sp. NPDC004111]|uniref:NACHT domain-containing protein n=1 Tax=Streptomyces sp. NPDC004111 TaxID=3364690 RepID=UPI00369338C9